MTAVPGIQRQQRVERDQPQLRMLDLSGEVGRLDPAQQRTLISAIEKAYEGKIDMLRTARDRRLGAILRALEQARLT